jgi:hypothetical protein
MAKCQICGADLPDLSQRFCGGERCQRVFMRPSGAADRNPPADASHRTTESYICNRRGVT